MSPKAREAGYVVPTYLEPDPAPWYHFLHGNVPGHQIDFMYRAEVPQGPLTRQHFSHLARLMKYIEPQAGCPYAFAIGNLSRDDTQHEPGHGGLALMFGLRIQGITDHAGRQDPPFAHGVAAIDRQLDGAELLAAAGVFHRHVLEAARSAEWYRSYVRCATERPAGMREVLATYVAGFDDLPSPPPSSLELRWTVGESTPPSRVVIVHDDDAPFEMIAACAAKIAGVLFASDIRWSAISNGREADLPNGVTVRLVEACNVTAADEARGIHRIEAVPDDDEEIARQLFGATSATEVAKPVARGWRDEYAGANAGSEDGAVDALPPSEIDVEIDRASSERAAPTPAPSLPPSTPARSRVETTTVSAELAQPTLKAVLPFTPVLAPASAPLAGAPRSDVELAPSVRKPALTWRSPAVGLGSLAILIAGLYLGLRGDPTSPAANLRPQPTSAAPTLANTIAPTSAVTMAPIAPTIATAASTATVVAAPKVAPKATAPTRSAAPRNPGPRPPKPRSPFEGSLTE